MVGRRDGSGCCRKWDFVNGVVLLDDCGEWVLWCVVRGVVVGWCVKWCVL